MSINWEFIIESLPLYENAAWLTLKIAFWSILISMAIGLICSIVLYYRIKILQLVVKAYIGFHVTHHCLFSCSFYTMACRSLESA